MIKCYIVDDEEHAIKVLSKLVEKTPELELLGTETNPLDAWHKLDNQLITPDIVFLDIDMPQISGIHLAELIKDKTIVIFTTAHPDYAIQAYDNDVVDYLLKPITYGRFLKAVSKAKDKLTLKSTQTPSNQEGDYFYIKGDVKGKMVKVKYAEINYVKGQGNYLKITLEKEFIQTYLTMKELEERLPKNKFARIHKSYIVNLQKIIALEGNVVRLENGTEVHVGAGYRNDLFAIINPKLIISKRT